MRRTYRPPANSCSSRLQEVLVVVDRLVLLVAEAALAGAVSSAKSTCAASNSRPSTQAKRIRPPTLTRHEPHMPVPSTMIVLRARSLGTPEAGSDRRAQARIMASGRMATTRSGRSDASRSANASVTRPARHGVVGAHEQLVGPAPPGDPPRTRGPRSGTRRWRTCGSRPAWPPAAAGRPGPRRDRPRRRRRDRRARPGEATRAADEVVEVATGVVAVGHAPGGLAERLHHHGGGASRWRMGERDALGAVCSRPRLPGTPAPRRPR